MHSGETTLLMLTLLYGNKSSLNEKTFVPFIVERFSVQALSAGN